MKCETLQREASVQELARLGCTGWIDYLGRLQHDGDTCPVHEAETIESLTGVVEEEL